MKKWISALLIGMMMVMSAPNMARANQCGGGGGALGFSALRALAEGKPMWFVMAANLYDLMAAFYLQLNLKLFFAIWGVPPFWANTLLNPPPKEDCFFCGRHETTSDAAADFVDAFLSLGGALPVYRGSALDAFRQGAFGEVLSGGFETALTPRIGIAYDITADGKKTTVRSTFAQYQDPQTMGTADQVLGNPFALDRPLGGISVSPYARPDMTDMPHFGGFSQSAQVLDSAPQGQQETEQQRVLREAAAAALKDPNAMKAAMQFGSPELRAEIERQLGTPVGSPDSFLDQSVDRAEENAPQNQFQIQLRISF